MATKEICRIGDSVTGTCRVNADGHPRTFIGTWQTGSTFVKCNGIPVVRVGDTGITDCGHTFEATEGSSILNENDTRIHRVGDAVTVIGGGEGVSITGSETSDSK